MIVLQSFGLLQQLSRYFFAENSSYMPGISRLLPSMQILTLSAAILSPLAAQTPDSKQTESSEIAVLHTQTNLVVVDVTVEDKKGRPVHGLKRDDFILAENKQAQITNHFEEHSSQTPLPSGPELPPMAPGTFTDYTAVPPNGTLTVLLLDTLNTPVADQSYVRSQVTAVR